MAGLRARDLPRIRASGRRLHMAHPSALGAEAGGGHGKPADSLVNYTRSSVIRRIGLFLVGVIKRSPPRNSKEPAVALLKPERLRANTLSSCAAHRGGRKRDARQSCAGGSPERKCTDETHATNNFGRAA